MTAVSLAETVGYLRARIAGEPRAILVLGSGLGGVAEEVEEAVRIPYSEIPGFPHSTVAGHAGALVAGRWAGVDVVAMAGRFHLYEGWSPTEVARPIRALASLGPRVMLVTNAAGGLRPGMRPGDLMLIADHLNLMWQNPLIGRVEEGEERFPDMSDPYDAEFRRIGAEIALDLQIPLDQGVYAGLLGPSYETPAEIRMLARLGADAVGMSTVPETLVARARGIRVLGISCITNLAAGLSGSPLSHDEVMEVGHQVRGRLARLVAGILPRLVAHAPPA
jgi:purine-nucleoside phosphorylase